MSGYGEVERLALVGENQPGSPVAALAGALRGRGEAARPSLVHDGMSVEGQLICEGLLQVEGEIVGEVSCARLKVGRTGHIEGTVRVERDAVVAGRIEGCLQAPDVHLAAEACVVGTIVSSSLLIERGAYYETTATIDGFSSLHVVGHIVANIRCRDLTISEGGAVEGDIVAERIQIDGMVRGTIRGGQVTLRSRANVHGDIYHTSLAFEQGAVFEGKARLVPDAVG